MVGSNDGIEGHQDLKSQNTPDLDNPLSDPKIELVVSKARLISSKNKHHG